MKIVHVPTMWSGPLNHYLAWLRASDASQGTVKLQSYHLRRFAVTTGLHPFKVALVDLVGYIDNADWKTGYRRSVRTTLRGFYRWAKAQKLIRRNPAKHLPKISTPPGAPRPAPESAVRIGTHTGDQRTRLMVRFAAEVGLRCCEIAVIHADDLLYEADGPALRVHGKGRKIRIVPLSPGLALEIERAENGYVFPGRIDGHLSAEYVSKLISRVLPGWVTAHPLRHRFASVAYVGTGKDIRAVQELLGHASVATTQIYTKVPDGAKRRGVLAAAS